MFVIVNRYILGIGVFTFLITSTVWSTENKDELVFAQVVCKTSYLRLCEIYLKDVSYYIFRYIVMGIALYFVIMIQIRTVFSIGQKE